MQRRWEQYVSAARKCCPDDFWRVFQTVQGEAVSCRDKVLHVVKDVLATQYRSKLRWPRSTRTLQQLVFRRAGTFWESVTVTKRIDLRSYRLPGCEYVHFTFIDPVYVWICRCNDLHKQKVSLQWDAKKLTHPSTGEEMYGAGFEYSLLLREASTRLPAGAKAGLFNISWDSGVTGFGARSAVPICVRVSLLRAQMNVDMHDRLMYNYM